MFCTCAASPPSSTKADLLAAHGLLALIRAAQRLNPRTRTRRLCLRQGEDEQRTAGMLGGDVVEQIVVSDRKALSSV
jgi:hypothetical protein